MHRRRLLTALAVPATASVGGCLARLRHRTARIGAISVSNLHDEPHRVEVRVERNGERLYDRTFDLPRSAETGTEENPAPVVREPWMDDPARFEVSARLAARGEWYAKRFPNADRPGPCYGVGIRIGPEGVLTMPYDAHAGTC